MAREPVKSFLESAGNGPRASKAVETVAAAAAAAFPVAHDAVQRNSAAGERGAVPVAGEGERTLPSASDSEGGKNWDGGGVMDSPAMKGGGGLTGVAGAEETVNRGGDGSGGGGGDGAREAAAEQVLAMEREDSVARVSACREAIEGWWERQRAALEEGLRDREAEAEDRR